MPEVHVPQLEAHDAPSSGHSRRKSIAKLLLEVVLISGGVFMGVAGEQWRENAQHRELARETLQRFRSEIVANQQAVSDVMKYHADVYAELEKYLAEDPKTRKTMSVHLHGVRPVPFKRTAWDVAIATQALEYIEPSLVFDLSEIYDKQGGAEALTRGFVQAMYLEGSEFDKLGSALDIYYGDMVVYEPQLLKLYSDALPKVNQVLAGAK